jgi:hypothetical protein
MTEITKGCGLVVVMRAAGAAGEGAVLAGSKEHSERFLDLEEKGVI